VGDTVIGYIRGRRVQRAQHLLEHTTLPIKTIAAQVGIEDTRHFYKVVHAILGQSPTQVRHNAQTG
jgi:AraC family transcriptional regulator